MGRRDENHEPYWLFVDYSIFVLLPSKLECNHRCRARLLLVLFLLLSSCIRTHVQCSRRLWYTAECVMSPIDYYITRREGGVRVKTSPPPRPSPPGSRRSPGTPGSREIGLVHSGSETSSENVFTKFGDPFRPRAAALSRRPLYF